MTMYKKQLGLIALSLLTVLPAHAASDNASQASKHSALAAGHSTVAGSQVVSGAVAVPLIVAGAVGNVSGEVGESLMKHAREPRKLEISDEIIVADPAPRHLHKRDDLGQHGKRRAGGI